MTKKRLLPEKLLARDDSFPPCESLQLPAAPFHLHPTPPALSAPRGLGGLFETLGSDAMAPGNCDATSLLGDCSNLRAFVKRFVFLGGSSEVVCGCVCNTRWVLKIY